VLDVADSLHWFSEMMRHWAGWTTVFRLSGTAAAALADRPAEATHLGYQSWAWAECDPDVERSAACAARAVEIATAVGDDRLQGWACFYAANTSLIFDRYEEGLAQATRAAGHFDRTDDRDGQTQAQLTRAVCLRLLGRNAESLAGYEAILGLLRSPGGRPAGFVGITTEAGVLAGIGTTAHALGDDGRALAALAEALRVGDTDPRPITPVLVRVMLARVLRALGRTPEALDRLQECRAIERAAGMPPDPALTAMIEEYERG
jgi:hypothetical protein